MKSKVKKSSGFRACPEGAVRRISFQVSGSGFRVSGCGLRVKSSEVMIGSGFREVLKTLVHYEYEMVIYLLPRNGSVTTMHLPELVRRVNSLKVCKG
jgi:hypothetical protein